MLQSTLVYLGVVIGGVTLFLMLSPVFGYLAYSDRPGPGWYGRFPALGWAEFVSNAADAMSTGAFFVVLFAIPGLLPAVLTQLLSRRERVARAVGGVAGLLLTGWWMMGAGWYIAAGVHLLTFGTILGAIAGGCALPRPLPRRVRHTLVAVPLVLLFGMLVEIAREMGPLHAFAVYVRADATHEQDARVWRLAMDHPDHPRAVRSGGRDAEVDGSAVLVFTFRPRTPERVRAAVQARVRASGLADSVVALPPQP